MLICTHAQDWQLLTRKLILEGTDFSLSSHWPPVCIPLVMGPHGSSSVLNDTHVESWFRDICFMENLHIEISSISIELIRIISSIILFKNPASFILHGYFKFRLENWNLSHLFMSNIYDISYMLQYAYIVNNSIFSM